MAARASVVTVTVSVYPSVCVSLSACFRVGERVVNAFNKRDSSAHIETDDGFRGRVSQVRILPGPHLGSSRSYAANAAFLRGILEIIHITLHTALKQAVG